MDFSTQYDVARLAGVSQTAVGAVLNPNSKIRISTATRQKILTAAKQLNYSPHSFARAMRTGKTGLIIVLVQTSRLEANTARAALVAEQLRRTGFEPIMLEVDRQPNAFEKIWATVIEMRAEGVVLCSNFTSITAADIQLLARTNIPTVSMNGPLIPGVPLFAPDMRSAFKELTSHLLEQGRTELMSLLPTDNVRELGPQQWRIYERREGLFDAVREAGNSINVLEIAMKGFPNSEDPCRPGWLTAQSIIEDNKGQFSADAVICPNDATALGVISALLEHGIEVPGTVSVTGFDNEFWTKYAPFQLTTAKQPLAEMATASVEYLTKMIRNGRTLEEIICKFRCEIECRHSSLGKQ